VDNLPPLIIRPLTTMTPILNATPIRAIQHTVAIH
jgi:hypothetical protein